MRASYFLGPGIHLAPAMTCEECGAEELEVFALTALTFSTRNAEDELEIELVQIDDASQDDYFSQEDGLTVRCPQCHHEWTDPDLRVHYNIE